MEHREFVRTCQPLNIEYRDMFNYIPDPADYHCTREQFLEALQKAVATKSEIDSFLSPLTTRDNTQFLY